MPCRPDPLPRPPAPQTGIPCAELQCWAFNPPGGLLSWELSQIAQAYCTSIVVGKDVISRLRCAAALMLLLVLFLNTHSRQAYLCIACVWCAVVGGKDGISRLRCAAALVPACCTHCPCRVTLRRLPPACTAPALLGRTSLLHTQP